ncbi:MULTISPECIES: hypothetical protein [Nocardioides]|uniref:Type 4 fimbrial biogenesis protein PilX N-terminal domain-containing protein n=1 Tax=Nocardioides vastitatis TaxID=2568655 RepID=A0ABW0ZI66_9ACTN|nr:hypothetical protein [Nocardioides sp.]THI96547.1 hypothetical protein E7Z54_16680 [Nocardioides sp.]
MIRLTARRRRAGDDEGAILIMAILVVTVVSLVVGIVLTRGDGSLRATVALREVAGSSYAADGAAQVAINGLRTGHWAGTDPKPPGWGFNNTFDGSGCFGRNTDNSAVDTLVLPNLYPATGRQGAPTSAAVTCEAEDATGAQGSPVPITNANKPGNAILTLGTGGETGLYAKPQGNSIGEFRVHGGIWSNSNIVADNGDIRSSTSIRANAGCSPIAAMKAPVVDCSAVTVPDPDYPSDIALAGTGVPPWQQVPGTSACDGVVEFEPGYYDDARALNAITNSTVNACKASTFWFKPGTYYFDFHNNTADPLFDADVAPSGGSEWVVGQGDLVAGTPMGDVANPSYPGSCQNPIDDVTTVGVQFVFGGESRMKVNDGANAEICGSYHADRPPIVLYALKAGTATPIVLSDASGDDGDSLTATGVSVSPSGTFNTPTPEEVRGPGDGGATWTKTTSGTQTGTISLTGLTPPASLPKGSVLKGAVLRVTHNETTAASTIKVTPAGGSAMPAFDLPVRLASTTDVVDLSTKPGWGALQKAVHDNGLTAFGIDFAATLKLNESAGLDGVRLELTYYVPQLRAQNDVGLGASNCLQVGRDCGGGTPGAMLSTPTNYKNHLYIQGTTYAPISRLDLNLNQATAQVMRFGVVARSLAIRETGAFAYEGPVIELPDNSPGWGFGGTLVQLKVYLCPGQATCSVAPDRLALKLRVQVWDPSGMPEPPQRQMTVLSWSHVR